MTATALNAAETSAKNLPHILSTVSFYAVRERAQQLREELSRVSDKDVGRFLEQLLSQPTCRVAEDFRDIIQNLATDPEQRKARINNAIPKDRSSVILSKLERELISMGECGKQAKEYAAEIRATEERFAAIFERRTFAYEVGMDHEDRITLRNQARDSQERTAAINAKLIFYSSLYFAIHEGDPYAKTTDRHFQEVYQAAVKGQGT